MKDKKTSVITFRTEDWVKEQLEKAAKENKWSVAQTVSEICKKFVVNPRPEEIIVKASDLINLTNEIKSEGENKGVQIIIDLEASEDEKTIHKKIEIQMLESGGHGCISGFDPIYEMTQEEILDIP